MIFFQQLEAQIVKIVGILNDFLWSNFLLYGLLGAGIIFSLYLGFPQITRFWPALKQVFGPLFSKKGKSEKMAGSMSSFQALATAIAAQVGTGNVAGVATAIIAGGPGAVFWMWISAFFGMGTIFNEAVLSQIYREKRNGELVGGPAYYISKGFKEKGFVVLGKSMAGFFSVTIIIALGFVGNLVQSNSIANAANVAFGIPQVAVGILIAIVASLIFIGGMKRIASFAELVVPIMAVVYIIGSITVCIMFREHIGDVFKMIFEGAFSTKAIGGGIAGTVMKEAMKKGVARGLFSNEAGMGSTPHAHAVAHVKHPVEQGLTAMVGVFVDTMLVCSATALTILATGAHTSGLEGAAVTQEAFRIAFGSFGEKYLAVCLTFFAFTTIIGWYYFGESNIKYLFSRNTKAALNVYRVLVMVFIVLGSLQKVSLVWDLADVTNGIMVIPNLIALLVMAATVKGILGDYDSKRASGNIHYDYKVK